MSPLPSRSASVTPKSSEDAQDEPASVAAISESNKPDKESPDGGIGLNSERGSLGSLFCLLQCQLCGFPVIDVVALQTHTLAMHSDLCAPSSLSLGDASTLLRLPSQSRKRAHSPSPGRFSCSQCDAPFTCLAEFVVHMRSEHLVRPATDEATAFACRICKTTFANDHARLAHTIEHFVTTSTTYTCQSCGKVFDSGIHYRQHFGANHGEALHRCGICLQLFSQTAAFQEHMQWHVTPETKYSCSACRALVFDSVELLEAHVQLVHDRDTPAARTERESPPAASVAVVPAQKPLKCFVCDRDCADENALDEHRLVFHCKVPKGDRCAVCREQLMSIADFSRHAESHSDGFGDMNCIVCRQAIRNDTQLRLHAEYHLDVSEDSSRCTICNDVVAHTDLACHLLRHASSSDPAEEQKVTPKAEPISPSSPRHVCHCGRQFEDPAELSAHVLDHLTEALPGCSRHLTPPVISHECPKCGKHFASLSALQGHSHVHMTTKVFRCDQCQHTFSSAVRLQQHKVKHLTKHDVKCRICDQRFSNPTDLQSHMRVHESNLTSFVRNASTPSARVATGSASC